MFRSQNGESHLHTLVALMLIPGFLALGEKTLAMNRHHAFGKVSTLPSATANHVRSVVRFRTSVLKIIWNVEKGRLTALECAPMFEESFGLFGLELPRPSLPLHSASWSNILLVTDLHSR